MPYEYRDIVDLKRKKIKKLVKENKYRANNTYLKASDYTPLP